MAMGSEADFFGGYDHAAEAGFVHWADHHIAPGKKQWTWGNHAFGHAWDRELTDADGPYVELMAGVFTDNQPDFSFLAPYETRTFSQWWYPIRAIGPAHQATLDAAVSVAVEGGSARVGVSVTRRLAGARVLLEGPSGAVLDRRVDLAPDAPFVEPVRLARGVEPHDLRLRVEDADGERRDRRTARPGSRPPTRRHPPPSHRSRRRSPARRRCSSPGATSSSTATPPATRPSTGGKRCAATRATAGRTRRSERGTSGGASSTSPSATSPGRGSG